jgi:hypothetical protein
MENFSVGNNVEHLNDKYKIWLFDVKSGELFFAIQRDGNPICIPDYDDRILRLQKFTEELVIGEIYPASMLI